MKFASFLRDSQPTWGLVDEDRVLDLGTAPDSPWPSLKAFLCFGADTGMDISSLAAKAERLAFSSIRWLPVIPDPGKIICIGVNYPAMQTVTEKPAHPTVFTRFADTQVGQGGALIVPKLSEQLDFEGELAIVIGRAGRHISEGAARGHIAGFACYNDASVRDFQHHSSQFTPGKNFPSTGGFGPWMVTADAFGEPAGRWLTTRVNGTVLQNSSLGAMLFGVDEIVAYCSAFTPLRPGDVIITGSPAGNGASRQPKLWLKQGDVVEVEIDGIGVLRNPVAAETWEGQP